MNDEKYVDAKVAAEYLSVTRRRLLDLARAGIIPAHPVVHGKRRDWRFLLSELKQYMAGQAPVVPNAKGPISESGKAIAGPAPTAKNSTEPNRSTSAPGRSSTSRRRGE